MTVLHVLLFVLHVCMMRECEGDGNAGDGDVGAVVVMSAVHVGGTRGLAIVSSPADVLGMREVSGTYMCLTRGGVGSEWMRGLVLGRTNPVGTGGVLDVCLCGGVDG